MPASKHLANGPAVRVEGPGGPQLGDWNLLRSFMAIYDTGTLTEAARRLGTTQPSMGRHLKELEGVLGETLFVRLPGRLQPNLRAQALYASVAPMGQAVREAQRVFSEQPERVVGTVRVAVAEMHAHHLVPRLLAPLLVAQPSLEIELSVSNSVDNLLRREADIAVRFFRPEQDGVIARKLGMTELGLFAHESYLARFGEPDITRMDEAAFLCGADREPVPLGQYVSGAPGMAPLRFRFRSDSALARHAAMLSGAGLSMCFVDIARLNPALHRVLADKVGRPQEVWLCAHDELRRSARMRFVWDRLGDALAAHLAG